jgi:hypothetical protein
MPRTRFPVVLSAAFALGACAVAPPSGPSVAVMPGGGKDFARFQQEDATCRQNASAAIGHGSPSQAATGSAVGSAAVGTVLGAGAGALIGSATGAAGAGAAIGAGTGLVAGSAIGAGTARASYGGLQRQYDVTYLQCMHAYGNRAPPVSVAGGYPYGPYGYPYGPYGYPGYYGSWPYWGPTVAIGLGFGFGRVGFHRHRHHFHHHRFHRGGFRHR